MDDPEFDRLFLSPEPRLQGLITGMQEALAQTIRRAWSKDPAISAPALEKLETIIELLGNE